LICHCGTDITGETAIVGEPMCATSGYEDDYLLLLTCPRCGATHSLRIWQSEAGAMEDAELERMRDEDGIVELIADTAGVMNHLRDTRRHDHLDTKYSAA
jgi:hypothetical protein